MGNKFLELEEVKESGRWTESGVEAPKAYNGHKRCAHCDKKFIVHQLKPGREPLYCSKRCKVAAYVKRKGINEQHPLAEMQGLKGAIDKRYLAQVEELREGQKTANNTLWDILDYMKKIYELLDKQKNKKERKKPHAFIKRRRDVSFDKYLQLIQRYNKIYGFAKETNTQIRGLQNLHQLLKSKDAEKHEGEIEHQLNNLERRIKNQKGTLI